MERGAYVSLDGVGSGHWTDFYGGTDANIGWSTQLADAGWFDPGQPPGFEIEQVGGVWTSVGELAQEYRSVPEDIMPAIAEAGFSEQLIGKLCRSASGSGSDEQTTGGVGPKQGAIG